MPRPLHQYQKTLLYFVKFVTASKNKLTQTTDFEKREQSRIASQNGLELLQKGMLEEAEKLFLKAHHFDPNNIDNLNLLGIRAYQKNEFHTAITYLKSACELDPNSPETLSNLGLAESATSNFLGALDCFDMAIANNPNIPETHNNRGNALRSLNKNSDAIRAYEEALKLRPNYSEALANLGVIFLEEGNPEKAIPFFQKAIEISPNLTVAFNNLGNALTQLERYQESYACFERALQLDPNYLEACLNYGTCLKKTKQIGAAIDCYQYALKIDPQHAYTYYLLGEIYYDIGSIHNANFYLTKSLELNQSSLETQLALCISQIPKVIQSKEDTQNSRIKFAKQLDKFEDAVAQNSEAQSVSNVAKLIGKHPFYLAYQTLDNKSLLLQYGNICVNLAMKIQAQIRKSCESIVTRKKIKVGIVSGYFYQHPVWDAITKGWITCIDPEHFEIEIFNTSNKDDSETQIARHMSSSYFNCGNSVWQAAELISAQNLDVLMYPEIGMDTTCRALACLRLAPTQLVSWGHPETSGLSTIDFFLSGELYEPENADYSYTEKLIKLPNLGTHIEDTQITAITPDLNILGIKTSSPILICAGSPSKYSPENDLVFIEIAKRLDKCQFVFFNFEESLTSILKNRLENCFLAADLEPAKFLVFAPFLSKELFCGLMQKSDLYLDTIGFSGFNTAVLALSCNLPVITLEGGHMRGRLAGAILRHINLHKFICRSQIEYIDLVVELIQNKSLLSYYKNKITELRASLFNDMKPIVALENFLLQRVKNLPPR